MRNPAAVFLVAAALMAGGCASSDLAGDTGLAAKIVEGLPVDSPAPSLVARAVWFPKANGAASTRNVPGRMSGMVALSGKNLCFLIWNDALKAYDTMQSFDLVTARRVRVDHGVAPMLVIQSRNLSFDSLELMHAGLVVPDGEATERLFQLIQALRTKFPNPDNELP